MQGNCWHILLHIPNWKRGKNSVNFFFNGPYFCCSHILVGRDDVDSPDSQQQHGHHLIPQRQQGKLNHPCWLLTIAILNFPWAGIQVRPHMNHWLSLVCPSRTRSTAWRWIPLAPWSLVAQQRRSSGFGTQGRQLCFWDFFDAEHLYIRPLPHLFRFFVTLV